MEVRPRRRVGLGATVFFLVGSVLLLSAWYTVPNSSGVTLAFGLTTLLIAVAGLGFAVRPFHFAVSADGLWVRAEGMNRLVRWDEIEQVVIKQNPPRSGASPLARLALVVRIREGGTGTAGDPDDPPPETHSVAPFTFDEVNVGPDQLARVLAQYGGDRFVDQRPQSPWYTGNRG